MCAFNCISKSFKKGKTSDFHAESKQKIVSIWEPWVLTDMTIISSVVFYDLGEAFLFCLYLSK